MKKVAPTSNSANERDKRFRARLYSFLAGEVLPDALFVHDEQGRFVEVNRRACECVGYTRDELLTMSVPDLAQDVDVLAAHSQWKPCLAEVSNTVFSQYRRKDGSKFPAEIHLSLLEFDHQRFYVGLVLNITERKRAQEALQQSSSRLYAILEATPAPLVLNDEEGNVTYLNSAFARTFGYSLEDIPTLMDWWQAAYPDPDYRQWVVSNWILRLNKTKHENSSFPALEICVRCKDGQIKVVQATASPLEGNWQGEHLVSLHDITERKAAEETARKLNAEFTATLKAIPDILFDMDRHGTYLEVWAQNPEFLARKRRSLIGRTATELLPAEAAAILMSAIREADEQGSSYGKTLHVDQRNRRRWFELSVSKKTGAEGADARFIVLARDATDRKTAEETVMASEEFYHAIADHGQGLIWMAGLDNYCHYFNSPWFEFTGRTFEEEIGLGWTKGVHPDDLTQCLAVYEQAISTFLAFRRIYRLRRHDGQYRWVVDEGSPRYNDEGGFSGYVGHCLDITDIKTAQDELTRHRMHLEQLVRDRTGELQDANQQLNAVFSLSPDGFVALAPDGSVKFANPAFQALTGIGADRIVGKDQACLDAELRARCESPDAFAGIPSYFSNMDALAPPNSLVLKSPRRRVLQMDGIRSESPGISSILYLRDITRQAEVDQQKTDFFVHAAHELRTPMTSILGFSELLLLNKKIDDATRDDFLETIHRQTGWLVYMINELLDLSRIEAGRGNDLDLADVDLKALVQDAVSDLAIDGDRWPVALDLPKEEKHVVTDVAKLRRAITNVLGNAKKYSPEGGEIRVGFLEAGNKIGIEVTDHGIGMAAEELEHFGERFWRADASGNIPGTGLGISIVKEILKLLGGSVEAKSLPQQGTTVTLWLPFPPAR